MKRHLREDEFVPYLDGRLSPGERARVEEHLAACSDCRTRHHELQVLLGVLAEWKAVGPSPGFTAALRARVAAVGEEQPQPAGWLTLRPAFGAALAAAVLLAIGVTLAQWTPPSTLLPSQVAQTTLPETGAEPEVLEPGFPSASEEDLAVLDTPLLLENYELLEAFDALFETLPQEKKEEEKL